MNVGNLKHISIILIGILLFAGCGGGSNASRGTWTSLPTRIDKKCERYYKKYFFHI
jgi:hypothetical protein